MIDEEKEERASGERERTTPDAPFGREEAILSLKMEEKNILASRKKALFMKDNL